MISVLYLLISMIYFYRKLLFNKDKFHEYSFQIVVVLLTYLPSHPQTILPPTPSRIPFFIKIHC